MGRLWRYSWKLSQIRDLRFLTTLRLKKPNVKHFCSGRFFCWSGLFLYIILKSHGFGGYLTLSKIGRMIGRPPCCCFKRVDSADVLLRTCAISHYSQKTAQKSSSHIAPELITQTKLLLTHHFAQKENASDFDSSFGTQARYRFHHEGRDVFFFAGQLFWTETLEPRRSTKPDWFVLEIGSLYSRKNEEQRRKNI